MNYCGLPESGVASKPYKDALRFERDEVTAKMVALKKTIDASYIRISSGKKLKIPIRQLRKEMEALAKESKAIEARQQEARRARQLTVKMKEMSDGA